MPHRVVLADCERFVSREITPDRITADLMPLRLGVSMDIVHATVLPVLNEGYLQISSLLTQNYPGDVTAITISRIAIRH